LRITRERKTSNADDDLEASTEIWRGIKEPDLEKKRSTFRASRRISPVDEVEGNDIVSCVKMRGMDWTRW